jgi:hypothetical protein
MRALVFWLVVLLVAWQWYPVREAVAGMLVALLLIPVLSMLLAVCYAVGDVTEDLFFRMKSLLTKRKSDAESLFQEP